MWQNGNGFQTHFTPLCQWEFSLSENNNNTRVKRDECRLSRTQTMHTIRKHIYEQFFIRKTNKNGKFRTRRRFLTDASRREFFPFGAKWRGRALVHRILFLKRFFLSQMDFKVERDECKRRVSCLRGTNRQGVSCQTQANPKRQVKC